MSFFKDFAQSFASSYGGLKAEEAAQEREIEKVRAAAQATAGARMEADIAVASHKAKLDTAKEKALQEQRKEGLEARLGVPTPQEAGLFRAAPTADVSQDFLIDMDEVDLVSDVPQDIADINIADTPAPAAEEDPVYMNYKLAAQELYTSGKYEEAEEMLNKGLLESSKSQANIYTANRKDQAKREADQAAADRFLNNAKATGYEAIYAPNFTNVDDYFWGLNKSRAQKAIENFKPDAQKRKTYTATIERALKMLPDITFTTGEGGLEALALRDSKAADFLGIVDVLTVENFGGKLGVGVSDADVKLIRNAVLNSRSRRGAKNALVFGLAKAERGAQYANAIETYVDVNGTTNGFNRLFDAFESSGTHLTTTEDGDYALRKGKYDNFNTWLSEESDKLTTNGVMDMRKINNYIKENTPTNTVTKDVVGDAQQPSPKYTKDMTIDDLSPADRKRLEDEGLL